jgi:hypothetical protein
MEKEEKLYLKIGDALIAKDSNISHGKMMTSPGLKYKNKVFAFFHNNAITFKLGKEFDPEKNEISRWDYLSPFKNKPPMKAWFELPYSEKDKWKAMAFLALQKMKEQVG